VSERTRARARFVLLVRLLGRDWRAGELRLLLSAVLVAVATVTAISLFVDRLQRALVSESSTFLAADRVISSSRPIPDPMREAAERRGLRTADTLTFPSMVFSADRNQLVSVKAVSAGYPLRGALATSSEPFVPGPHTDAIPSAGEVWLDSRLFPALALEIGDAVTVGVHTLRVARVLTEEPDRGGSFFDLGPRLLMNLADVPATEVVQPGSRLRYRLLLAGPDDELAALRRELDAQLEQGFRWRSIRQSSPSIGDALDRAESFLLLGGLLAVLLAGVAVALGADRYARRHYDHVAICKTLGATPADVQWGFLLALFLIGAVAVGAGLLLGGVLHLSIVAILRAYLPVSLPAAGLKPLAVGSVTGFVCLIAFALPPIMNLRQISPMRVIRRDLEHAGVSRWVTYACAGGGSLALLVWYTDSWWLTAWTLTGVLGIVVVFGLLAMALLRGGRVVGMQAGNYWRLALASLQRRHHQSVAQILIFGLAIMLLLILLLTRLALLDEWRQQIPERAPNHFLMNIVPDELADLETLLRNEVDYRGDLFPMMRGRIVGVNGISAADWEAQHRNPDAPGPRLSSERNLSWAQRMSANNTLLAGAWWDEGEVAPQISVEEEYAGSAGLSLGDSVEFNIGGFPVSATVTSIRRVEWDSMEPNFFILFSPGALGDIPATYMTSFYLPADRKRFLNELLGRFPTVTVIEVDKLISQVQSIIGRVTQAVELVLALVLVSGALVLIASIQASRDERLAEHALLRTLGATRRLVTGSLSAEFALLGLFAGVIATIGAEVTAFVLQTEVFQLPYRLHPWLWPVGSLTGLVIVLVVGLLGTRKLVSSPPVAVLRELS
jgi:putative ABC transport system permease protein